MLKAIFIGFRHSALVGPFSLIFTNDLKNYATSMQIH